MFKVDFSDNTNSISVLPKSNVSVIIPTKNEGEVIEQCLRSVFNQSVSPCEVMIVDGGSTDNTLDIVKKFDVKIIKEGKFSSPANARNLGAESARGNILLMMDADVVLQKDCLKYALEIFEDKNAIVVLPSALDRDHSHLEFIQRKWNEGARTPMNIGLRMASTSGLVAFFRKKVFEKVKFDTAYGFGEDDDFSSRLEKECKPCKVLVAENCKVISHSPHTMKELATRYMWWGRTFFAYLVKHFGFKSILNMGGLLLPTLAAFFFFASLLLPQTILLFVFFFTFFIVRILITCIRSRSALFIQFVFFDLSRSFFFIIGLLQSFFTSKKGR